MIHKGQYDIRVMIVEDDPLVSALYQSTINEERGFRCEHTYASCHDALLGFAAVAPDVILMDIGLPDISGCQCLSELRLRKIATPVLILTAQDDDDILFDALAAGASGYLLKGLTPPELLTAIREAYENRASMSPEIARRAIQLFRNKDYSGLGPREQEILTALSHGDTSREISMSLGVPKEKVKQSIYRIYTQLVAASRDQMKERTGVGKSIGEHRQQGNVKTI